MWVQPRIDDDVRDEVEDRDPDRLVNLTYCRAVRVRGVRSAEGSGVGGVDPVDDTSNPEESAAPEPEAPAYRRWEVVAALAVERAAPGSRTTEILAAVAAEDVARTLFREIRGALLEGRAGLDLSVGAPGGKAPASDSTTPRAGGARRPRGR